MEVKVICLEERAFFELLETVIEYINKHYTAKQDKWITPEETMKKLNIKSKTTLSKLRKDGLIRYSQPDRRIIMYDRESIDDYYNGYAKKPFALRKAA